MVRVHATGVSYTNSIFVVFDDVEGIERYELYRDGEKIAESAPATSEDSEQIAFPGFEKPTVFDHDKHTNLFRKNSNHELMFEDVNVRRFHQYGYRVKYYFNDGEYISNTVYITLS